MNKQLQCLIMGLVMAHLCVSSGHAQISFIQHNIVESYNRPWGLPRMHIELIGGKTRGVTLLFNIMFPLRLPTLRLFMR